MVDEEDENEGLVDEHEDLSRVLDYYEKKFKEKVGIMPAVVETDEIEMDLIVGMDSDQVLGIRLIQFIPVDGEADGGKLDPGKADSAGKSASDRKDDAFEDDICDMIIYDLTRSEDAKAKVSGKVSLEVEIAAPRCEEDEDHDDHDDMIPQKPGPVSKTRAVNAEKASDEKKFWVHIVVLTDEDAEGEELKGAVLHYINKPQVKFAFLPNPDLN